MFDEEQESNPSSFHRNEVLGSIRSFALPTDFSINLMCGDE